MRKQRTLTRPRWLVHHHKLTIPRLQPAKNLIRRTLLPRRTLPPKKPQPEISKILQRTLRLRRQRLSNNLPTHLNHPKFSSSHQPRTSLIPTLKPISRRNPQPSPLSSPLHPQTRIPRLKIPTPTLQIHLLHSRRLPHNSTPALAQTQRTHIYPSGGRESRHTPRHTAHPSPSAAPHDTHSSLN